jgi:hypothetical protein
MKTQARFDFYDKKANSAQTNLIGSSDCRLILVAAPGNMQPQYVWCPKTLNFQQPCILKKKVREEVWEGSWQSVRILFMSVGNGVVRDWRVTVTEKSLNEKAATF